MSKQEKMSYIIPKLYEVYKMLGSKYGYEVCSIYLQGSQNYDLDVYTDSYKSDVDMKAFVMPSERDLYYNMMTSTTYKTPYGLVEVKDIRLFVELLKKSNLTYLELLCTDYYLASPVVSDILYGEHSPLIHEIADAITKDREFIFLNALRGTAKQKYDGVFKSTEISKPILEKYGYQPKELHHLYRLLVMARDVVRDGKPLSQSYVPSESERELLIKLKTGEFCGTDAVKAGNLASGFIGEVDSIINPILDLKKTVIKEESISMFQTMVEDVFFTLLQKMIQESHT